MSVRKILNASSGYTASTATVSAPSDASFSGTSLLLTGDPSVVDPNFASVSLLLTGNDLLDKSNNKATVTTYGNVAVTSINKKFGTGSYYFDGTGDYLTMSASSAFDFSSGTFTIEFWINYVPLATGKNYRIAIFGSNGSTSGAIAALSVDLAPNQITIGVPNASVTTLQSNANSLTGNTWTHCAASISPTEQCWYINGVKQTPITNMTIPSAGNIGFGLGIDQSIPGATKTTYGILDFNGYIDDLRITKGVARYTANFTPPTQALPSHEILDSSVYSLPITTYGNARIDTTTKKYGTGSMYFDGSSYIRVPASTNWVTGTTSSLTIEYWFYPTIQQYSYHMDQPTGNASAIAIYVGAASPNNDYITIYNNGYTAQITNITLPINTWTHFAFVLNSGVPAVYINGILQTGTYTSNRGWGVNQPIDIGRWSGGSSLNYTGYIDDFRVTKDLARYTANFTPPTAALPTIPPTIAADPWWGNVSLLLDGNTTDAYDPYWQNVSLMLTGDDFIDWSNNHYTVTKSGAIATDTTSKKYNSGSIKITTADTDYATANTGTALGSSNFTIEFWFKSSSTSGYCAPFMVDNTAGGYAGITFTRSGAFLSTSGNSWDMFGYGSTQATAAFDGNWHHIALCRSTVSVYLFIDGASIGTPYNISTNSINATPAGAVLIGKQSTSTGFTGNIADFRITKGVARYTANFTPPIAALPAFKIQDRTQNALTLTPYGNVQLSTDVKKNGTGSMYFWDSHVYFLNSDIFDLSNKDFTLEAWIYPLKFTDYGQIFSKRGYSGRSWQLYTDYGTGWLSFSVSSGQNHNSTATPALNAWSHAALSYTYSDTTARLFLNGVLVYTLTTASFDHKAENIGIGSIPYPDSTQKFYGYIDDARITKGVARYASNFTPPSQSFATQYISTGFDPNYADVSLLLTGEGTNGSTTFTDLSSGNNAITAYGTAQVNTSQKKYGVGSIYIPNATSYLKCSNSAVGIFNTDDFTIECWSYFISVSTTPYYQCIFCTRDGTTNAANTVFFGVTNTGYLVFYTTSAILTASSTVTANTWNHVALVRKSGVVSIYLNGVSQGSASFTTSLTGTIPTIGNEYNLATGAMNGYFDDLRITKGVARYTTNFTPPTYALATTTGTAFDVNRADTSLLLRGNGTNGSTSFTDESPNNLTVTNNGSVTVNTTTKKYGTGSMYFNGSANLYSNTAISANDLTGDYTIEFWANISNTAASYHRIICLHYPPSVGDTPTGFFYLYTNSTNIYIYNSTVGTLINIGSFTANTWFHCALVRLNGAFTTFINGQSTYTKASATGTIPWGGFCIGGSASEWITGYIDDLRITKGYARYTANFTPPTYEAPIVTGTQYDDNYAQVSLLLNGDGTNGSTTFTDLSSSPKTITNTGSVTVNTTTKKFGTGSIYFSGTNTLSAGSIVLGTNNFTIEFWFNQTSQMPYSHLFTTTASYGTTNGLRVTTGGSNLTVYSAGTTLIQPAVAISNGAWYHFALVRNGTTLTLYQNGVSLGSTTTSISFVSDIFMVGGDTTYPYNGYIDDFRVTNGIARYTQNFTPPTAPLPTSGGY